MQLIKKLFYSILILAGIGIMVVLFMFAIMMIFHVSIFGYTYSSVNNLSLDPIAFSNGDVSSIELETGSANVDFYYTESGSEKVYIQITEDFQGIVKDDVKRFSMTVNEPDADGKVVISTTEPSGFFFTNSTTIHISLPAGKSLDNILVKTQSNSVSFGKSDSVFEVKNLKVVSTSKSLKPGVSLGKNLKVTESLGLETYAGRINVDAQIFGDVDIKTNIGTIIFNNSINGSVIISGENPCIEFGTVNSGFINNKKKKKNYDTSELQQINISGNVVVDDVKDGGSIKISGTVGGFLQMKSPNLQLWANNIDKGIICEDGSNEILIFGSLGKLAPERESTLIVSKFLLVNEPYSSLAITAKKDGVVIRNAHNNVFVENDNLETRVDFADDAIGKTLSVTQHRGNIIANNIQGRVELIAEEGNVTATFKNVSQNNQIEAKNNADIKVEDGLNFNLITKSYNGTKLNIDLGSIQEKNWPAEQELIDGKYKQISQTVPSGSEESENTLSVFVTGIGSLAISLI